MAGIKYRMVGVDGPLFADFHSLRHSYISGLQESGASVKEAQALARHSDPRLTLIRYTHKTQAELAVVVEGATCAGLAGANKLAERAGFVTPAFHNSIAHKHFQSNPFAKRWLRSSSHYHSIPVVPSHGGYVPGQNRDKNCEVHSRTETSRPEPPGLPRLALRPSYIRTRSRRDERRSKAEIEAERQRLRDEVVQEIDLIVTEMHARLPRHLAKSIGIAYARYSTEFQHSVADQVRGMFEAAVMLGIFIPREYVFFDLAVRGCKERRPGLDQVRHILSAKKAEVLLVFTTNRLFRKSYKCAKFVEEEVVERGLRCIFVKSGIDTAETGRWRLPLQIHALCDEVCSTMYADNIRAAQEGLFLKNWVTSTIPFGYMGREIEGPLTKKNRVRRELAIEPETAEWVRIIYRWFVEDRLPMARIVERLNDLMAPLSPMSNGVFWSQTAVRYLLGNPCYRGTRQYGKHQNIWQGQADYSRSIVRDKPLREMHSEDLRIVSDETWNRAQQLLAESPQARAGRKPKDGDAKKRPRLLNGLLFCKEHARPLKVGGDHGHLMTCPDCQCLPKAKRAIYSYLNRAVCLRLLCRKLAEEIRKDKDLIHDLMLPFQQEAERQQQGDTGSLDGKKSRHDKVARQIQFLLDNLGDTEADRQETSMKLKTLRAERSGLAAEISLLDSAQNQHRPVPTEAEFRDLLTQLEEALSAAGEKGASPEAGTLRAILELLTGGRIEVEQQGERRACRGWLRLRFHLRVVTVCSDRLGFGSRVSDLVPREITVDIREETIAEENIARVMELYDKKMLITAIADTLGIDRHQVTAAVQIGHKRRGLAVPKDGRARRALIPDKQRKPAVYKTIADEVKRLYDENLLIVEIAMRVAHDIATVHSALHYWFTSRGLPAPSDGRQRRKNLPLKNRPKKDG